MMADGRYRGFSFAVAAALGLSASDFTRKRMPLAPMKQVAMLSVLECAFLVLLSMANGAMVEQPHRSMHSDWHTHALCSGVVNSMAKVLYVMALRKAEISVVIPLAALDPAVQLLVGTILAPHQVSFAALIGVLLVSFGGMMLVSPKDSVAPLDKLSAPEVVTVLPAVKNARHGSRVRGHKLGALFMVCAVLCWSVSSQFDRAASRAGVLPSLYMSVVKGVVGATVGLASAMSGRDRRARVSFEKDGSGGDAISSSALPLWVLFGAVFEAVSVVCYFMSLKTLPVSYAVAMKRACVVVLSQLVGAACFGEAPTTAKSCAVTTIVVGVVFVVGGAS